MSPRRHVLMVNYYFPPLGGIASIRALRFARHLGAFGWTPHILTVRAGDYHADPELDVSALEGSIERTRSLEISRLIRPVVRAAERPAAGATARRGTHGLRMLLRRWVYFPDAAVGWYPFAVAAGQRMVRRQRPDAIFSSSGPITAHLVARRLAEQVGVPWVAEFRDLWSEWSHAGERRRRREQALERAIVRRAAHVITVSATYADVLAAKGAPAVSVITNGFDPERFESPAGIVEPTVAYLGTFYPAAQDIGTALSAMRRLRGEGLDLTFQVIGAGTPDLTAAIARAGLAEHSRCSGFLPHPAALAAVQRARMLLLAGPVSDASEALRGNVAAKVFEYLGARRPILVITAPNADLVSLLRPFAHVRCVAPGDVTGACEAIRSLVDVVVRDDAAVDRFAARELTRKLAQVLDRECR